MSFSMFVNSVCHASVFTKWLCKKITYQAYLSVWIQSCVNAFAIRPVCGNDCHSAKMFLQLSTVSNFYMPGLLFYTYQDEKNLTQVHPKYDCLGNKNFIFGSIAYQWTQLHIHTYLSINLFIFDVRALNIIKSDTVDLSNISYDHRW